MGKVGIVRLTQFSVRIDFKQARIKWMYVYFIRVFSWGIVRFWFILYELMRINHGLFGLILCWVIETIKDKRKKKTIYLFLDLLHVQSILWSTLIFDILLNSNIINRKLCCAVSCDISLFLWFSFHDLTEMLSILSCIFLFIWMESFAVSQTFKRDG